MSENFNEKYNISFEEHKCIEKCIEKCIANSQIETYVTKCQLDKCMTKCKKLKKYVSENILNEHFPEDLYK